MKVIKNKRWGEILIRKATDEKNVFDMVKSFSIEQSQTKYDIENYREILKIATNLTEKISFDKLKKKLMKIK